jgi:hypothetical protein
MMDMLSELGDQMQHTHEVLDEIQDHLSGRAQGIKGGYLCSYPVFQGIYRMVERMIERGGQSIYLMLCTIVDGKGNPMREGAMLDELSERLGVAQKGLSAQLKADFSRLGLPVDCPYPVEDLVEALRKDKKAVAGGKVKFVLLRAPGDVVLQELPYDCYLHTK